MSNFFDQFDGASAPVGTGAVPAAPSNFFDQFDPPPAAPGRGVLKTLDDYMGLAAKGLSFGLADRIGAAGDTLLSRGDYADNLAKNRAVLADEEQAHPIGAPVTEFAAGAALPFGALGLGLKGATLGGRIASGAATGAGLGAVSGAASAPDWTDPRQTAIDTALGAGAGAALGGGLPVAGAAAAKAYGAIAPFLSRPIPDASRTTTGILANALTPKAADALSALGPDAMLADASPSLTGLAGGVAARPGSGQDALVDALMSRQAGQADRLGADRNAALGPAMSPQAIAAALDKTNTTTPLLDQAFQQTIPWSAQLDELSRRPAVAKALRSASDAAADQGHPLPSVSMDEAGNEVSPSSRAAYEAYAANAVPRTQQALADLLGHGGTLGTQDAVVAQRAAAAGPLYDQFRAGSIETTPELAGLLQRPSVRAALPTAERLAQDEGKSIYVGGKPGQFALDPLGSDSLPVQPPGVGDAPPPEGDLLPRPVKPDVPRPQSLVNFLQSAGGVRDIGGDLKAAGHDRFPGLVRKEGGLSPDMARQAAAQAGYLGPNIDEATSNTTPNDLFDALDRHPSYSIFDDDAVHQWEAHDDARALYDAQGTPQSRSAAPPRAPLSSLDPGADAAPARQITPEGWDFVQRAVGDLIGRSQRRGDNNASRVYTGLKGELTAALDKASPVYGQARQMFASHSALLDALEAGKGAAKPAATAEQVEREFGALGTDGERQMYRLGAGNTLRDLVAARGDTADLARSVRGNLAIRQKLATLAPSGDALRQFNGTLDAQSHAFDEALRPDVRGWAMARDNLRAQQAAASGDKAAAIGKAADALDEQLHAIPEMMRADLARQTAERGQASFDAGRKVLRGGDDQPWPGDLSADFNQRPIEQQALLRAGARSDIEQRFGQNRNDLAALARLLGDQNDVNRAHMGTLFGDASTKAMADALSREQTFSGTSNRVVGNSATAGRLGGSKVIDDATKPRDYAVPKDATVLGLLGHAGEALLRAGARTVSDAAGERTREQLGRLLSLSGAERDRVVSSLSSSAAIRSARAQALARALAGPQVTSGALAERRVGR